MNQKSNQLPTQLVTNQSKKPITELIGAIPDPNPQFVLNRNLMSKLAICNMCYIDEYTCTFKEFYYKGIYSVEESKEIRKLYFTKLPEPFSSKILKDWNNAALQDTLGEEVTMVYRNSTLVLIVFRKKS